jgi:hypothetical protein
MSRIVIVILINHRHKPIDLIFNIALQCETVGLCPRSSGQ